MYRTVLKRFFDLLISFILIIVLSPILSAFIIVLVIVNKGTPFYFQDRPGKNERIFTIIKLKTMNDSKDAEGNLLEETYRITKIGALVRKISLDECLQLVNVIKGDMSLIGPRPLLIRYLPFYTLEERKRHSVLPGITGLAQISGRNFLSWEERFQKDIEYVNTLSFNLDLKILFKTFLNIIKQKDIEVDTSSATLLDFDEYRSADRNFIEI